MKPVKNPNPNNISKLFKSLQEKIPTSHRPSGDDYIYKLNLILKEFHSRGFNSERIAGSMLRATKHEYIGYACELSAAYSFMRAFPCGFAYQVESGAARSGLPRDKRKNFDFAFMADDVKFSVEVKTFKASSPPPPESLPVKSFLTNNETSALHRLGFRFSRNCMPALGRFLRDANDQLARSDGSVGIVLICCNDINELSDAISCFASEPNGIYSRVHSDKIVPAPHELMNIDGIVFCILAFDHNAIFDPTWIEKIYGHGNSEIDGCAAWDYRRSAPVYPLLTSMRHNSLSERVASIMGPSFFLHNPHLDETLKNGAVDLQDAIFKTYNKFISRDNISI